MVILIRHILSFLPSGNSGWGRISNVGVEVIEPVLKDPEEHEAAGWGIPSPPPNVELVSLVPLECKSF
jgi:hypothetical protein